MKDNKNNLKKFKTLNLMSILESLLFSTNRPQSLSHLKKVFEEDFEEKEEIITDSQLKESLKALAESYEDEKRGVTLEEVSGGYQIRTKSMNAPYVKRLIKSKTFRLSPSALEVLSIVAYKQPCIKADVDQLRGVESGHLLRSLMEKGLVRFLKKSDFPGKPMLYSTTKKFLEVFQLKSLKDLPPLHEIEELISREESHSKEEAEMQSEETRGEFEVLKNISKDSSAVKEEKEKRKEKEEKDEEFLKKVTEKISSIQTNADFLQSSAKEK